MRLGHPSWSLAIASTVALSAATGWAEPASQVEPASRVEYIAVEPNTGGSSGGHAALRVGGSVYHYMAGSTDSLLLLYRVSWDDFHRRYCLLENRGLRVSRLGVNADTAAALEAALKLRHAVQDKHLDRLGAVDLERRWSAALAGDGPAPSLAGLGLFQRGGDPPDPAVLELSRHLATRLDVGAIDAWLRAVTAELRSGALETSAPGIADIEPGRYPAVGEIAAERLSDRLALREALLTLRLGRGLDDTALRVPDDTPLDSSERAALEALQSRLAASVARLLRSPRPDRGRPILIATARYLAVRRSLAQGRMVLLDSFSEDVAVLDPAVTRRHRELLRSLTDQTSREWRAMRAAAFADGGLDERTYNLLELAASRHAELSDALRLGRPVRIDGAARRPPGRPGPVTMPDFEFPPAALAAARASADDVHRTYSAAIERTYGFDLFRHNCATELIRAMRSAFPDGRSAAAALGDELDVGPGPASFIPSALSRKVHGSWNVTGTDIIPSRRKREVAGMVTAGRPVWVRVRESNRLTSRAYPGSIEDDAFLFFADGRPALRPLQGVANLTYGLGHGGLGILTLPFDGGWRAAAGARGMFWSAPELVGVSIRKGRYDLPPDGER